MNIPELIVKEGLRKGIRNKTIKTYVTCVNKFFRTYRKDPKQISKNDIENYFHRLIKWGRSGSTINVHLNALKFFYEKVLKKKLTINIKHTRTRKRLPEVLTKEEVKKLFSVIKNKKHQLMIKLLYSTGMRVSELVSLKVRDFEFNKNYGWIRDGKGGKDRLFIIANKLRIELISWISESKLTNEGWLFPGQGNSHISISTIQAITKTAASKAEMNKNVHPHTLRHSFATHLIENGYAVTEIQPLLGHNSANTTMIYLHTASPQLLKVKSPFDKLDENSTCQV